MYTFRCVTMQVPRFSDFPQPRYRLELVDDSGMVCGYRLSHVKPTCEMALLLLDVAGIDPKQVALC